MNQKTKEYFSRAIDLMRSDLDYFEKKYQGWFAEEPHIGLGNRKTRCVNEATLPIITCTPECLNRCAGTCYVLAICTLPRPNCRKCEARNTVLRRIDPRAYYEHFFDQAEKMRLPIRLSDGGDIENEAQVKACIAASCRHPSVHAIMYTKRCDLLRALLNAPNNLHVRYSAWEDDALGVKIASDLGYDFAKVVTDGSGNCPYQKTLARFFERKSVISSELRRAGVDIKEANRRAEKQASLDCPVWYCRNCAEQMCGCCGKGEIRFNVVGEVGWTVKAARRVSEVGD